MSLAVAGHGATIAMELDPTGSQGVFTVIAELNSDLTGLGLSRPTTDVTPHQDTIDSHVSGVLRREPWTFTVNYVYADTTHDGLRTALLTQERTGFRFRGTGGTTDTDEIIASGEVTSWNETNPVREGARTAEVTVIASKEMIVDGTSYGSAA
jgi:hypothetical protein